MKGYPLEETNTVNEIGQMNITGNVIPERWYKTICRDSGKPYLAAIMILSEIVYWFRPVEYRDEHSGAYLGLRKKFKADKLQMRPLNFANKFGISKQEAQRALKHLEELGVIDRELRTVECGDANSGNLSFTMNNVPFIGLHPNKLKELTFDPTPSAFESSMDEEQGSEGISQVVGGHITSDTTPYSQRYDNTENTTEITTENSNSIEINYPKIAGPKTHMDLAEEPEKPSQKEQRLCSDEQQERNQQVLSIMEMVQYKLGRAEEEPEVAERLGRVGKLTFLETLEGYAWWCVEHAKRATASGFLRRLDGAISHEIRAEETRVDFLNSVS